VIILRRLYDWVLSWAATPYGSAALFVLAFFESSFFPIPPDPLLIALILGARSKAFRFATVCSVASVTGALLGYAIGYFSWWTISGEFTALAQFFFNAVPGFTLEKFELVQGLFERWNFWIVFTAGFTPLPFKIFTISGGAFDISLVPFVLASLVGRSARFFLVAWLIWRYGARITLFIDKYFNKLAILFTFLLIGGFALLKML
jgi:membrane protein YqaA with SNARE-associated domain